MKSSVYPSKIDWWLAGLLILTPIIPVSLGAYSFVSGDLNKGIIGILFGVGLAIVMGLFSIPCNYTITEKEIKIKCGLYRDRIQIEKIRKVFPTKNPLSAPTLSLKRIKIETDYSSYLISPKNREEFIQELEKLLDSNKAVERNA